MRKDCQLLRTSIEQKSPPLSVPQVRDEIDKALDANTAKVITKETQEAIHGATKRGSPWGHAKSVGLAAVPSGEATVAARRALSKFRDHGLFIVEVGELEGFARSAGGHGPSWLAKVLEKDLTNDPELETARAFIREVLSRSR